MAGRRPPPHCARWLNTPFAHLQFALVRTLVPRSQQELYRTSIFGEGGDNETQLSFSVRILPTVMWGIGRPWQAKAGGLL
mmetsp:Transcript_112479/g.312706  ORF Transcript_112479/g.312706 Transcript_112479/m.312706 type:complete len:80 (+) Transcript_112479:41-280(+)